MDEIREQHNPHARHRAQRLPARRRHFRRRNIEGIASVRAVPVGLAPTWKPPRDGADHAQSRRARRRSRSARRIPTGHLEDIFVSLVSTKDSEDSVRASVSAQAAGVEGN